MCICMCVYICIYIYIYIYITTHPTHSVGITCDIYADCAVHLGAREIQAGRYAAHARARARACVCVNIPRVPARKLASAGKPLQYTLTCIPMK